MKEINYSFKSLTGKPLDAKYLNTSNQPYSGTSQVLSEIPISQRYKGLTVLINNKEYWFASGVTNSDLVLKTISEGVSPALFNSYTGATAVILENYDNRIESLEQNTVTKTLFSGYTGNTKTIIEGIDDRLSDVEDNYVSIVVYSAYTGNTNIAIENLDENKLDIVVYSAYTGNTKTTIEGIDNKVSEIENNYVSIAVYSAYTGNTKTVIENLDQSKVDINIYSGYTGATNFTLDDHEIRIQQLENASGSTIYDGATPATVTVGGITSGTQLTGKTVIEILEEMLVVYLEPTFSAFSVSGQNTTVEAGIQLSGNKTFTWTTTNSSNVQPNSIVIRDVTSGTTIATGLADDGSQSVTINTRTLVNAGDTQSWRAEGTNTNAGSFNSSNFTVTARYYRFYGPSSTNPANSAQVRALPNSSFQTANSQTFTFETGTEETSIYILLPPGRTISSVIDIDALNANITSSYVLVGTVSVNDGGGSGTARIYNKYVLTLGEPYSESHTHSVTTA